MSRLPDRRGLEHVADERDERQGPVGRQLVRVERSRRDYQLLLRLWGKELVFLIIVRLLTGDEGVVFREVVEEDDPEDEPDEGDDGGAVEDPDPAGVLDDNAWREMETLEEDKITLTAEREGDDGAEGSAQVGEGDEPHPLRFWNPPPNSKGAGEHWWYTSPAATL